MGKTWYWFYNTAVMLTIIAIGPILFFTNPSYVWLLLCMPAVFILAVLVRILFIKKTKPIIDEYNKRFNLHFETNDDFSRDRRMISAIQYLIFADYLNNNNIKLTKEEVSTIIEALKYESSSTGYKYRSLPIIIAFLGILTAAFLGSWLQIRNSFKDLIIIALKCFSIFMIILILMFTGEQFLIKEVIRSRRNRYQRLIRVLENYSVNSKF